MKTYSTIELKTVLDPPITLNICDYINCPICDIEIDVRNKIIDIGSFETCEDCNHIIKIEIVKI